MNTSSRTLARWVTTAGLLLLVCCVVVSCSGRRSVAECYDASQCSAEVGELVACIDAECETVDCLSALDCPMGQICDIDGNYECVDGCNSDGDCPAGSTCGEKGTCETYGCRSTILDCDFGEFCNESTGACEADNRPHCTSCDPLLNEWDVGDPFDDCDDFLVGNGSCGGAGSVCNDWDFDSNPATSQSGCYVACQEQSDCPMGFMCWIIEQPYGIGGNAGCDESNTYQLGFCVSDCAPQ
jgi:hypothetical protein